MIDPINECCSTFEFEFIDEEDFSLTFGEVVELPDHGGGSSLIDGGTTGQVLAKKSDANQDVEWIDPPESIVDTVMSDSSENAVQNKIIKEYVDTGLADKADAADTYTKAETDTLLDEKQNVLTAGNGIKIENDIISGTKVDVSKGSTNIIEVESYNSSKLGFEFSQDDIILTASSPMVFGENRPLQEKLTAGDNITIENNTISTDDKVFVAVYEQTSYADVKAAIDAHKAIVLDMPANNNQFTITYSTYTNGGNALMYAIYKMSDNPTLMTVTLTPTDHWTVSHTDLQEKLVSGTNIKTVNGQQLLGEGNVETDYTIFISSGLAPITKYNALLTAINEGYSFTVSIRDAFKTQLGIDTSEYAIPLYITIRHVSGSNCAFIGVLCSVNEGGKEMFLEFCIKQGDGAWILSKSYEINDANLQSQIGTLTDLTTDNKDNLVNAINEVYEKSGEPFRVKQWGNNALNVEIPTCTEDIDNISIPKMVFTIDNVEGADYQIVGMLAYEVFDATSGGNRINCWPVCQFTGNGQKELSVRWMCGGTTRKTAKRINAWVLLKHR